MARSFYKQTAMNRKQPTARLDNLVIQEPLLWKCIILAALSYLVWSDKLSIVFDFAPPSRSEHSTAASGQKIQASLLSAPLMHPQPPKAPELYTKLTLSSKSTGHGTYIMDPNFAERNQIASEVVSAANSQCRDYVDRFAPVAIAEMHKFGIPASIILAQGLLESNAGDSRIALNTNNHFGIKCFSNKCKKGHCVNFTDDSHKDFFKRYENVWSSYRDHSKFLKDSRRYSSLFKLAPHDYRGWAKGLANAGYATDKQYAEKLIALIQNLQLYKFDQQ